LATKKSTEKDDAPASEQVVQIPLSELHPFEGHPFKVVDDELMQDTVDSIMQFGVLTPAIARPDPNGGYEMVAGHRRLRASEIAGKETMPVIVRNMTDDEAIILMVDSNLQRENILPSERAFAYRMKLEAIKHQGKQREQTSSQVGMKLQALDLVGQQAGDSRNQVHRYIRLTELIPPLMEMVDSKQLAFNPAVELSYLKHEEQKQFLDAMDYAQATPSLSQAQRLKKLSQDGKCTSEAMCAVMSEEKKSELDHLTLRNDVLSKYFPKSYTPQKMQETIIKLLEQWQKKRQRDNVR
jgi:ParB family chromosome partitioning protein